MKLGAQGGGGVTILEDVQGTTGHGTQCSGLVDKMVIGQRLEPMILEVFFNPNDSINTPSRGSAQSRQAGETTESYPHLLSSIRKRDKFRAPPSIQLSSRFVILSLRAARRTLLPTCLLRCPMSRCTHHCALLR